MAEVSPLRPHHPRRLGAYDLLGLLGDGGQGTVFLARSPAGDQVAVKLLHVALSGDARARERLRRELTAARRVARFCTAAVLDADISGDRPYVVSEYVPGPSLSQLVRTHGPRAEGALQQLAIGTMTALNAIHQAGVVHRDFKPGNVLMGPEGPRVIDFGVARVVDASVAVTSGVVGTPAYMAPEVIGGQTAGTSADLFAWGVTMAYAASGRPAFGDDAIPAVITRIVSGEPDLGDLREPLRGVVAACLAKDPAARPTAPRVLDWLLDRAEPPRAIRADQIRPERDGTSGSPGEQGTDEPPGQPAVTDSVSRQMAVPAPRIPARVVADDAAVAAPPARPGRMRERFRRGLVLLSAVGVACGIPALLIWGLMTAPGESVGNTPAAHGHDMCSLAPASEVQGWRVDHSAHTPRKLYGCTWIAPTPRTAPNSAEPAGYPQTFTDQTLSIDVTGYGRIDTGNIASSDPPGLLRSRLDPVSVLGHKALLSTATLSSSPNLSEPEQSEFLLEVQLRDNTFVTTVLWASTSVVTGPHLQGLTSHDVKAQADRYVARLEAIASQVVKTVEACGCSWTNL